MSTVEAELQGLARLNAQLESQVADLRALLNQMCVDRDRLVEKNAILREALDEICGDAKRAQDAAYRVDEKAKKR